LKTGLTFLLVGPKKVLSNMIKDINPSIPRLNVEDLNSLEATVKALGTQNSEGHAGRRG
jgi:hypothetical protein